MREYRLVAEAVATFGLDLSGKVVLTEAASNAFLWTPLIAALAGAERVYALGRDSVHGTFAQVRQQTRFHAERMGVGSGIRVLQKKCEDMLTDVDIITNLGFVRPIDRAMVCALKRGSVVCLMWEPWEFREDDIDLQACAENGIPVVGTNERDPRVATLDYLAITVLKLIMRQNIEVVNSRVLVLGQGPFVDVTAKCLRRNGARVYRADRRTPPQRMPLDCVVCLEHHDRRLCLVGAKGVFTADCVDGEPPCIIHICGHVDRRYIKTRGWPLIPKVPAKAGHMSFTTAEAGPRAVIDLHTAGLKVGQAVLDGDRSTLKGLALPLVRPEPKP